MMRIPFIAGNRPVDTTYRRLRPKSDFIDRARGGVTFPGQDEVIENYFREAFPLKLSVANYTRLCWRVKELHLTGTISVTSGPEAGSWVFDQTVYLVRRPYEDAPLDDEDFVIAHAAMTERDIVGPAKTLGNEYNSTTFGETDNFAIRNNGFWLHDPTPPVGSSGYFFPLQYPTNVSPSTRATFALLNEPISGIGLPGIVGAVYDGDAVEDEQVSVPFIFAVSRVRGTPILEASATAVNPEWVTQLAGLNYPTLIGTFAGPSTSKPVNVGTLTVVGLSASDIEIPLWSYGQYPDAGSISAEVTLVPSAFWPFTNSLNQPVYDGDTGVVVNDPFA